MQCLNLLTWHKKNYPTQEFHNQDVEDFEVKNIDYAFASGIFCCFKTETEMFDFSIRKIKHMYNGVSSGVGVNFLSNYSRNQDSFSLYMDPSKVLDRVMKEVSSKVVLRHDYMPNDFTLFIYKG